MNPNTDLEQLQNILLNSDRKQLQQLHDELISLTFEMQDTKSDMDRLRLLLDSLNTLVENPDKFGDKVNPLVNLKIAELKNNFSQIFGNEIRSTVQIGIRQSRGEFIDAMYPIIGKLVRRYVRSQFDSFLDDIGQRIENSLSVNWWARKAKSLFSGVSEQELLLSEALRFQIEEVFFVQHHSGLLLASYSRNNTLDVDMIAGMLTAIKSFVESAFNNTTDDLESINYGDYRILLTNFHSYYAASVVSGTITNANKQAIETVLTEFAAQNIPATIDNVDNFLYESLSSQLKQTFDNL